MIFVKKFNFNQTLVLMPAGATSTGDGEPLPGAEKKEATTRQRPAGATSTGAWGRAEVNPDLESLSVPKMAILFISR